MKQHQQNGQVELLVHIQARVQVNGTLQNIYLSTRSYGFALLPHLGVLYLTKYDNNTGQDVTKKLDLRTMIESTVSITPIAIDTFYNEYRYYSFEYLDLTAAAKNGFNQTLLWRGSLYDNELNFKIKLPIGNSRIINADYDMTSNRIFTLLDGYSSGNEVKSFELNGLAEKSYPASLPKSIAIANDSLYVLSDLSNNGNGTIITAFAK